MSTPLSTPIKQAKLAISSSKSLPLASEYKKLLADQHQRLWLKHQQDLDLIDDIRSYVKSRLSIERDYSQALSKLSKQHANHISKRFTLLQQCDSQLPSCPGAAAQSSAMGEHLARSSQPGLETVTGNQRTAAQMMSESEASDCRLQKRLANNGLDEPDQACTLYKVWSEHINRLQASSNNRSVQFEQMTMVVDKLKDIRSHKANIGKKCLDSQLKRIQEDILVSLVEVEKARKLYYEDESQAKKARENEEKFKKKRSGLLTKFTGGDLQAKKEKTSAQREANDIQSTQARNDYIMALAAANAHLEHYYVKDLTDFMSLIDDGVLDHCKIFMATLSECDINSLKGALHHAQYWSKMINLTGSQKTNSIFLDCEQSVCLKNSTKLTYEPCNDDPISSISLEHNADYALQHEIDKWFTWFKKECRNLSQLVHQLDRCQSALAEGQKSIELNGQTVEDLEPKIIELKQQVRKSEAAKSKAQARLKVIKEGGMQIEEWSVVESEIRADMARVQEELESRRLREVKNRRSSSEADMISDHDDHHQISKDSDASDGLDESMHNLASVSRSTSNLMDKQQKAISGYSALTDPSLVWQDGNLSNAWNGSAQSSSVSAKETIKSLGSHHDQQQTSRFNHLETSSGAATVTTTTNTNRGPIAINTVQSSSPLSAIMDENHGLSTSPYQTMAEAYKSDYECDYNRSVWPQVISAASSAEPYSQQFNQGAATPGQAADEPTGDDGHQQDHQEDVGQMLDRLVIAQYTFDKTNEDDLSFVEGDILRVIEISDSNWLQARNEATGELGFIPAPYVRLLPPDQQEPQAADQSSKHENCQEENGDQRHQQELEQSFEDKLEDRGQRLAYCRALYDYKPEADTYEQDGLPHLALNRGELLRVLDQGQEDGWWLVEKDDGTATRGHVPSMLVEELEEGEEEENEDDGDDDGDVSEISAAGSYPDLGAPPPPSSVPDFESADLNEDQTTDQAQQPELPVVQAELPTGDEASRGSSSLVPTSFIIIEPTPEVESRSFESQPEDTVTDGKQQPRGYSVINEDFVLEGPTRKPSQLNESSNYEPLSDCDDSDIPAPPSVVIESFEVERHDSSSSAGDDDGHDDDRSTTATTKKGQADEAQNNQPSKETKHTGNVDISPILRLRAEEFTKQIIAEAITMTSKLAASDEQSDDDNESPYITDYNESNELDELEDELTH